MNIHYLKKVRKNYIVVHEPGLLEKAVTILIKKDLSVRYFISEGRVHEALSCAGLIGFGTYLNRIKLVKKREMINENKRYLKRKNIDY